MKLPTESDSCFQIDVKEKVVQDSFLLHNPSYAYEACVVHSKSTHSDSLEIKTHARFLKTNPPYTHRKHFEELGVELMKLLPSIQQSPTLKLKQLPPHLRYVYLGEFCTLSIIILNTFSEVEEEKLLRILREIKQQLDGLTNIKGISYSLCMNKVLMAKNFRPGIESQRRLNPNM